MFNLFTFLLPSGIRLFLFEIEKGRTEEDLDLERLLTYNLVDVTEDASGCTTC